MWPSDTNVTRSVNEGELATQNSDVAKHVKRLGKMTREVRFEPEVTLRSLARTNVRRLTAWATPPPLMTRFHDITQIDEQYIALRMLGTVRVAVRAGRTGGGVLRGANRLHRLRCPRSAEEQIARPPRQTHPHTNRRRTTQATTAAIVATRHQVTRRTLTAIADASGRVAGVGPKGSTGASRNAPDPATRPTNNSSNG